MRMRVRLRVLVNGQVASGLLRLLRHRSRVLSKHTLRHGLSAKQMLRRLRLKFVLHLLLMLQHCGLLELLLLLLLMTMLNLLLLVINDWLLLLLNGGADRHLARSRHEVEQNAGGGLQLLAIHHQVIVCSLNMQEFVNKNIRIHHVKLGS